LGIRVLNSFPLDRLVEFIDWSPFFHTWELRGHYPQILDDPHLGGRAKELFADAQKLLEEIVARNHLSARGVYGFFAANAVGDDDIEVYTDGSRTKVLTGFHTLRQQSEKPVGQPNIALADYIAPKSSGRADHLGAFAVTSGIGLEALCERFEQDHDDY